MNDTDGVTSLREAIAFAESLTGPRTITFDPSVFGTTPQTITLTLGELKLTDAATSTIAGPGAGLLTSAGAAPAASSRSIAARRRCPG